MTYEIVKVEVVDGERRVSLVRPHVKGLTEAQTWTSDLNQSARMSGSGVTYEAREEDGRAASQ